MKRKKGNSRQWTPNTKRKTAKLDEDDAGEMKKKANGTKTTTEAVAELPPDVWGDIISRLPLKQVLLCRCICRAWNALLSRIHHPNPTLLYFRPSKLEFTRHPSYPGFQLPKTRSGNYTLAELRNGASYASTVTSIIDGGGAGAYAEDKFLWPVASCHGLVCFVRQIDWRYRKKIFVGNPLLKERLLEVRPSEIKMKTKASRRLEVVGFGFSPRANRYKILRWFKAEQDQTLFQICTVGDGSRSSRGKGKREVCYPSWRRLLSFPRHISEYSCPLGSQLNAGIHWLVSDSHKDNSVFISRLDLDTEQFERVEAPQSPDFNATPLGDLSLCVSDGHLIICANLRRQDIIDIWVMNQFNLWTKNLVVRSPILPNYTERVEVLNYGKVEAAAREGKVAEVMLLVESCRLYACTTRGRHMKQLDWHPRSESAIVHIPSLLSIKDVAKLYRQGLDGS